MLSAHTKTCEGIALSRSLIPFPGSGRFESKLPCITNLGSLCIAPLSDPMLYPRLFFRQGIRY
jgi:hypothetical protein